MKTFCCRFVLEEDFYTCTRISAKGMSIADAWAWAKKQLENNKNYIGIDDIYEVELQHAVNQTQKTKCLA